MHHRCHNKSEVPHGSDFHGHSSTTVGEEAGCFTPSITPKTCLPCHPSSYPTPLPPVFPCVTHLPLAILSQWVRYVFTNFCARPPWLKWWLHTEEMLTEKVADGPP